VSSSRIGRPPLGENLVDRRVRLPEPEAELLERFKRQTGCKTDAEALRVALHLASRATSSKVEGAREAYYRARGQAVPS